MEEISSAGAMKQKGVKSHKKQRLKLQKGGQWRTECQEGSNH